MSLPRAGFWKEQNHHLQPRFTREDVIFVTVKSSISILFVLEIRRLVWDLMWGLQKTRVTWILNLSPEPANTGDTLEDFSFACNRQTTPHSLPQFQHLELLGNHKAPGFRRGWCKLIKSTLFCLPQIHCYFLTLSTLSFIHRWGANFDLHCDPLRIGGKGT